MKFYTKKFAWLLHAAFMSVCIVGTSHASPMFTDDFENGLGQWIGKSGGAHHGIVVNDPLNAGNHVLTFTQLNSGGDIYSPLFSLTSGTTYRASFDYLGLAVKGSVLGDLGGATGLSDGSPVHLMWYNGTAGGNYATPLVDDGKWHHYTYDFTGPIIWGGHNGVGNSTRLMFQDYLFSGGVAGDAYFDNVQLSSVSPVPEPSSAWCFGVGLLLLLIKHGKAHPVGRQWPSVLRRMLSSFTPR